jgi:nitronate monooxygenase
MGGGLASHALAAAVSEAGGLGTSASSPRPPYATSWRPRGASREKPLSVTLIVPFARDGHWQAAAEAEALVTDWEARPRRRTARCGSTPSAPRRRRARRWPPAPTA